MADVAATPHGAAELCARKDTVHPLERAASSHYGKGGEPDLPAAGYAVIEIAAKNAQNTHMTTVTADGLILSEKIGTYYLFRDAGNLLHRYSGAREGVVGVDK